MQIVSGICLPLLFISSLLCSFAHSATLYKRPFERLPAPGHLDQDTADSPDGLPPPPMKPFPAVSNASLVNPPLPLSLPPSLPSTSPTPLAASSSGVDDVPPATGTISPGAIPSDGVSEVTTTDGGVTPAPSVTPGPVATPTCVPQWQCNIFFQHVNLYYWPEPGHNTACLANNDTGVGAMPLAEVAPPQSPSGFVVFPSIEARDGCKTIGTNFNDFTWTYAPGELSSVRADSSTYSFNVADLPCPPDSVHWTGGSVYTPQIAMPSILTQLDPAWGTCIPGAIQGIDPFSAWQKADAPSPEHEGPVIRRHKRAGHGNEHGRVVPRATEAVTTMVT